MIHNPDALTQQYNDIHNNNNNNDNNSDITIPKTFFENNNNNDNDNNNINNDNNNNDISFAWFTILSTICSATTFLASVNSTQNKAGYTAIQSRTVGQEQ